MVAPISTENITLDISSRLKSLFSSVDDCKSRIKSQILNDLVSDFKMMAFQYSSIFEDKLLNENLNPQETWLKRHQMIDKLTEEWHALFELVSAVEMGSSFLGSFASLVEQAQEDIGLTGINDRFILFPIFGESFSLVRFKYSSKEFAILKLPISAINSPWERCIIWHEIAGFKVRKITNLLENHLRAYANKENIEIPQPFDEIVDDKGLINVLFQKIEKDIVVDRSFRDKFKEYLSKTRIIPEDNDDIWSLEWFKQLLEDACSVFAFGEPFLFVLEKILGRNPRKLSSDRKHPDLGTRLKVSKRLLALRDGNAGQANDQTEILTDRLLWDFLTSLSPKSEAYLPIMYQKPADSPIRWDIIESMQKFKDGFDAESDLHQIGWPNIVNIRSELAQLISNLQDDFTDSLLALELSDTDDLDISSHSHSSNNSNSHSTMTAYVHGKNHKISGSGVTHTS